MSAISLLFVYERRESLLWFRRSQQWQRDAEVSFALNGGPTSATGMIALFHEIVGHDLIPCPGGQIRVGQMTIQVGMNCARSGWLEQVRDIREFDQVLVIASDSSLDVGVMDECLRRMKDEADVGAAIVLYPANEVVDVQQLRNISRTSNCSLIIVGPSELGELIRARAQDEDLGAVLSRSRVSGRFAEMLATGRILPPCLVTSGK